MQGNYAIFQRANDGTLVRMLPEYTRLHALLTLNNAGKWELSNTSRDVCPFEPNSGILVARNNIAFFGGILTEIQDDLDAKTGLHKWQISGVTDLGILGRRVCYVSPSDGSTTTHSHYEDTGYLSQVVETLIRKNIGTLALSDRREPIIMNNNVTPFGSPVSISLRFQNLLKAVTTIATANYYNIRPVWDQDNQKVYFELFTGRDLTDSIIFTEQLSNITASEYIASSPEGNWIIAGGKGEMTQRAFGYASDPDSISEWGRIEKFQDGRNQDDVDTYADETLRDKSGNCVGYSVEVSDSDTAPQFGKDYDLGDYVGMKVHGQFVTAQVQQVEIEVQEGIETISPKFGTVAIGKFKNIFQQLSSLRQDVDELLGTEIE